jgi:2-methylisocitrate lyase-like PEP mutase family enzyme
MSPFTFYQDAGAGVLYAPGLRAKEDIAAVVWSVDRPLNVVIGLQGAGLSLAELSGYGREADQRRQCAIPRRS